MDSIRLCCFPTEDRSHATFCLKRVDKTKLRNKLRDRLNKLDLNTSEKTLLKIAKQLGFDKNDIPHFSLDPPDYHNESGRPHFGPLQVRHASDLIKGKHYLRVDTVTSDKTLCKQRFRFEGFDFFEENEESDLREQWNLKLTPMIDGEREENYTWSSMPLHVLSLYPWFEGISKSRYKWFDDMWLEFLPENVDVCTIALQKSYEAIFEKAKNHPINWVGYPTM